MLTTRSLSIVAVLIAAAMAPVAGQDGQPKREKDVPYVPTREEVVAGMLKLAGVKMGDVLYDLGCGDGRIVITAAQKFGTRGVGIDIDPVRIKEATENAQKAGVTDKVKFIEEDLFEAKIDDATVGKDVLAGLARWPVTISYFDKSEKKGDGELSEQTPVYAISFEMYENGISRELRLDYGDFVIDGKMSSLEIKPVKACK